MTNKVFLQRKGIIIKSLGNNSFLVALEGSEKEVLAIVTSRFRSSIGKGSKRINQEDEVIVEFPPPNSEHEQIKGRIIRSFSKNKLTVVKSNSRKQRK
jgi:translation initiation factor IF-1